MPAAAVPEKAHTRIEIDIICCKQDFGTMLNHADFDHVAEYGMRIV